MLARSLEVERRKAESVFRRRRSLGSSHSGNHFLAANAICIERVEREREERGSINPRHMAAEKGEDAEPSKRFNLQETLFPC